MSLKPDITIWYRILTIDLLCNPIIYTPWLWATATAQIAYIWVALSVGLYWLPFKVSYGICLIWVFTVRLMSTIGMRKRKMTTNPLATSSNGDRDSPVSKRSLLLISPRVITNVVMIEAHSLRNDSLTYKRKILVRYSMSQKSKWVTCIGGFFIRFANKINVLYIEIH